MVPMFGIQINFYFYCFCTAYREKGPYGTRVGVYPGAEFPSRPLRSAIYVERQEKILEPAFRWDTGYQMEMSSRGKERAVEQ